MPTPALNAVNVTWSGAVLSAASPPPNGVNVTWGGGSGVSLPPAQAGTIEPRSLRLSVPAGVRIEAPTADLQRVYPAAGGIRYGSHDVGQEFPGDSPTARSRAGPRLAAGRPVVSFLRLQDVRGAGGGALRYGAPGLSLTASPAGAALLVGAASVSGSMAVGASPRVSVSAGHTMSRRVRPWPANVLRAGAPSISKSSPHP